MAHPIAARTSLANLTDPELIDLVNFATAGTKVSLKDLQTEFTWSYYRAEHSMNWLVDNLVIKRYKGKKKYTVIISPEDKATLIASLTPPEEP